MSTTDIQISADDLSDDLAGIIPFADEVSSGSALAIKPTDAVEDLEESAVEEFGTLELSDKRRSVVDRALGLHEELSQSARARYSCPCCGEGARRVMRVRVADYQRGQAKWVAVCAVCAASMLARVPGTIVGGMVRPTRRRRPMRVQAAGVIRQEGQLGFQGRRDTRYRRAG